MNKRIVKSGLMHRIVSRGVAGALLLCASQSVLANELSYSFFEIDYIDGDFLDQSADGFGISGSVGLGEMFFLGGSYQDEQVDNFRFEGFNSDLDAELLRLGVGLHGALSDNVDWVVSLDYAKVELSALGNSDDDSGYIVDIGLRGLIGDAAEYSFAVIQSDVGGSETGFRVGGRYHFGDSNVSAGLDYVQYESDWDQLAFGVRYQFD